MAALPGESDPDRTIDHSGPGKVPALTGFSNRFISHRGDTPMGEHVQFTRPDGQIVKAYLQEAGNDTSAPAVVVIQEWWGLNAQIKHTADRLAEAGFRALVPDLYRGKLATSAEEANHLMSNLDFGGALQDIQGAVSFLQQTGSRVAVLGFCMGGALSILSALNVRDVDAAVCFYGIPPEGAADPSKIRIPLQGHFGNIDDWCTPERVDVLEGQLKEGKVDYELHRYQAHHAFFNEMRPEVYDPAASAQAWTRSLEFLRNRVRR